MTTPHAVLDFLRDSAVAGSRSALIVLTRVEGAAARAAGTLMAVREDGTWCGSISGGCVEPAIAGEALRVMAGGKAETLRIGAGSPLIDIRLPCGSAIDLLIVPDPDAQAVRLACDLLAARRLTLLELDAAGSLAARPAELDSRTGWIDDALFRIRISPRLRLVIAGHGEEVVALAALARAWGTEVLVLTSDARIADTAAPPGEAVLLKTPGPNPALVLDRHSALVMLFHDHDWETGLLVQALAQEAFFIGAMGSRTTHANRLASLAAAGVGDAAAARIVGPIGLIPATRDPQTLAVSILAQVVAAYNAA